MRRVVALLLVLVAVILAACKDGSPTLTLMPTAVVPPGGTRAGDASGDPATAAPLSTPTATASPRPTATATHTPTPTPTATPTPMPAALISMAEQAAGIGDYDAALARYEQIGEAPGATDDERQAALLGMAKLQLQLGLFAGADATCAQYLERYPEASDAAKATFWLAQARQGQMDWAASIQAFEAYLAKDNTLITYVSEMVADSYLALGDNDAAVKAYETALTGAATSSKVIAIRERLAQAYRAAGELDAAIAQYDAIWALTSDSSTLARMDYLAGYALIASGRTEEGYTRYLHAVENYPAAYDSYLALIELIDAGVPVDDLQRGIVDYYAGAYIPAVSALYRLVEADPYNHPGDPHLFAARSYAALGNYAAAVAELDVLLTTHEDDLLWDDGWLEKAKIQAKAGWVEAAVATYLEFADNYPGYKAAPNALWRAAALREGEERWSEAAQLYRRLAAYYAHHEDAAEALLHAGLMAFRDGDAAQAAADWEALINEYPGSYWVPPALVWLARMAPEASSADYRARAAALPPDSYYAIRAAELAQGEPPFARPTSIDWPSDDSEDRTRAEAWLREWLELDPTQDVRVLGAAIVIDPRWDRGRALWELGLVDEARTELNGLRYDLSGNPLASYQLALAFREMGLYRSSILAAAAVIDLSPGPTPLHVPRYLAQLAYPDYYRELVIAAAADHDLDPLLLLAMIRQESLFESFARSWAAAQGLMQVIPSTGEYIAGKLDWPDYQNEDLYRPMVSIPFGAYYVAEQLDRFEGQVYVALSAYNAGPGNASYWYRLVPDDPDLYLEIITIAEPRSYIMGIYTHYTYYRALYGGGSGG